MAKNKVIILGAGVAGLSSAWHLKEKGISPVVFEREGSVGGLCRSKKVNGFVFDYDGHLLHFRDNYTLALVKKLLKGNLAVHERSAWINNFGIFSPYPFQANLSSLPKKIAIECLWGFILANNARLRKKQPGIGSNFYKWINTSFGKGIAKHFMLPYNKKFWTVPLNRMNCQWADKFIPKLGLSEVVNGFFGDNQNHLGYNASFWYPKNGGIIQLPLAFEKAIGAVSKNCLVSKIDLRRKQITVNGKDKYVFDKLILTIPLPELLKIAETFPAKIANELNKLRWNSIFNLNLGVKGDSQDGRHWVYFPHKEAVFFRAGFFHNFGERMAPEGASSLYAEVSYSRNKPINKDKIAEEIIKDLQKAGILKRKNKILALDANDIKYGYPVYDRNYFKAIRLINEFLSSLGIIACGRYGSWQYMSMEDAILDGKRAAQEIG